MKDQERQKKLILDSVSYRICSIITKPFKLVRDLVKVKHDGNKIYISLGYNCDPRLFIKHNLGLSKKGGYMSCPFDLCITNFDALCECLETDFQHFFENLATMDWNKEGNVITNHYGIIFNHEGSSHKHIFKDGNMDGEFYTRNDFQEFKKRYRRRIKNFFNYIKTYDEISFIYKHDPENPLSLAHKFDKQKLLDLLNRKYKDKKINLIIL